MNRMRDYKILTSVNAIDLSEQVKKYLKYGWEIYGTPFTQNAPYAGSLTQNIDWICQTIVYNFDE
jgi:hypothetical protein